eukprot:1506140-Prymnesium_polylepis.1
MVSQFHAAASVGGGELLPGRLPPCSVLCADLASHDITDADVCYLCSTAFTKELLATWTAHAAKQLRAGSRAITLSSPLDSHSFEVERCVQCGVSWGMETAYVHRRVSAEWLDGGGRLLAKGVAPCGRATEWLFVDALG